MSQQGGSHTVVTRPAEPGSSPSDNSQEEGAVHAYDLTELRSQGVDGLSYHAVRKQDQQAVECRVLKQADLLQRAFILRRVQQLELVSHPALLEIVEAQLEGSDPLLVLGTPTRKPLLTARPKSLEEQWELATSLCSLVSDCHRLGIAHGKLNPDWVSVDLAGQLRVDFTRARVFPLQNWEAFQSPAEQLQDTPDFAEDCFSLAVWIAWLFSGVADWKTESTDTLTGSLSQTSLPTSTVENLTGLLVSAWHPDPLERPTADDFLAVLRQHDAHSQTQATPPPGQINLSEGKTSILPMPSDATQAGIVPPDITGSRSVLRHPEQLGRYSLKEKLGEGGMGAVFRAIDQADGTEVAIKLLSPQVALHPESLQRFQKEARMLAEVRHPHVTNLVEINQDQNTHYLVLEFVSGCDLREPLRKTGQFSEAAALTVVQQVCRALAEPHQKGIVHRDIKPANLMLEFPGTRPASVEEWAALLEHPRVKLTDFGLARHQVQSESLALTQTGTFLGSPYYMAPEQCKGTGEITPAADVYSLGITLFEFLAGHPPFQANDHVKLISEHCFEPVPDLRKSNSQVTDEVCRILDKMLAKKPEDRYADVNHLLEDVERLLSGQPSVIELHPQLPECEPSKLFLAEFSWDLESTPEELWPYVSNTERINSAVGVPSVEYENRRDPGGQGVRKFGTFKMAGMQISWEEHPFEWVEGQRLGILREFDKGPFVWFASEVELVSKPEGGTLLKHNVRIEPRGWIGRMVANLEVKMKGRKALDKVYRRIDATVGGSLGDSRVTDPFLPPNSLSGKQEKALSRRLDALLKHQVPLKLTEKLARYIREAPAQELARIRPLALARRWNVNGEDLLNLCLRASQVGLLVLHWDILCPTCRIAADVRETLREIEDHAACEVCDVDFELDFANSLELFFRVDPTIRQADLATYCIGGPEHFAHVVAQIRLAPGEKIDLKTHLSEGEYQLRGAQLPYAVTIPVSNSRGVPRGVVELSEQFRQATVPAWKAGNQIITLHNQYEQGLLIRLERTVPRQDVISAAQASALPLFRELFPEETLKPGQLLNITEVTLASLALKDVADLFEEQGDARTFEIFQSWQTLAGQIAADQDGVIVKTEQDRLLLRFEDSCRSGSGAGKNLRSA